MKNCPICGGNNIILLDADNDMCQDCGKWFPAVAEVKEVYCHACSAAGGAGKAIYHAAPACKDKNAVAAKQISRCYPH